jgi:phosphate transport system substrate-binding protein
MTGRLFYYVFVIAFVAGSLIGGSASAGSLQVFEGKSGTIEIAGGTAHIPVMKEAAKRIMTYNPDIRITVAGGGSGVGIQKVGEGLVDIGDAGRPLSDGEQEKYGLISFPFAVDGVATVVSADNPVSAISSKQVREIFSGEITNWKEVGGENAAIHVYTRDEASGTRAVYWKKLLNKGRIVASANVVSSNGAMKSAIARDQKGIGYVSIGHLDDTVKAPELDGVRVTQETAKSGEYPVVRRLYMNTKGQPEGIVKDFIDYILSSNCDEIIISSGYIPAAD